MSEAPKAPENKPQAPTTAPAPEHNALAEAAHADPRSDMSKLPQAQQEQHQRTVPYSIDKGPEDAVEEQRRKVEEGLRKLAQERSKREDEQRKEEFEIPENAYTEPTRALHHAYDMLLSANRGADHCKEVTNALESVEMAMLWMDSLQQKMKKQEAGK